MELVAIRNALKLSARAAVLIVGAAEAEALAAGAAAVSELTLAGFVGAAASAPRTEGGVSVVEVAVSAPSFKAGAAAKFVPRAKAASAAPSAGAGAPAAPAGIVSWGAATSGASASSAAVDLVDEDALLDDDALPVGAAATSAGAAGDAAGCAPKRKACKNCSCGRKEQEDAEARGAAVTLDLAEAPAPAVAKSSCGNVSGGSRMQMFMCLARVQLRQERTFCKASAVPGI